MNTPLPSAINRALSEFSTELHCTWVSPSSNGAVARGESCLGSNPAANIAHESSKRNAKEQPNVGCDSTGRCDECGVRGERTGRSHTRPVPRHTIPLLGQRTQSWREIALKQVQETPLILTRGVEYEVIHSVSDIARDLLDHRIRIIANNPP